MRARLVVLALIVVSGIAPRASAQFVPFGFSPFPSSGHGRGYYSGRYLTFPGYARGYPGFYSPYGWSGTTIIISPSITVRSSLPPVELPTFPQVPPLEEREDVIVIKPQKGVVKNLPPPKAALPPPAKVAEPPPKGERPPLLAPPPAAEKPAEAERQIKLGKDFFAADEPGQALEHFRQAANANPENAQAHFLLAQTLFALGKYREAAAEIVAGLKRKPDWPTADFNPRELYGPRGADHADDLDRLRQAVERNPDDPVLQYIYGYQLWFIGRRKEARALFERAIKEIADPTPIRRFLDIPEERMAAR
jgi:Tetratricopeptide repeat